MKPGRNNCRPTAKVRQTLGARAVRQDHPQLAVTVVRGTLSVWRFNKQVQFGQIIMRKSGDLLFFVLLLAERLVGESAEPHIWTVRVAYQCLAPRRNWLRFPRGAMRPPEQALLGTPEGVWASVRMPAPANRSFFLAPRSRLGDEAGDATVSKRGSITVAWRTRDT